MTQVHVGFSQLLMSVHFVKPLLNLTVLVCATGEEHIICMQSIWCMLISPIAEQPEADR